MQEAKELCALETQRPLNAEQSQRWQHLAQQVFPRLAGEQRGSSRIPAKGSVLIGVTEHAIADVSWRGLRLAEATPLSGEMTITAICVDGQWRQTQLACTAVRDDALLMSDENAQRWHDYFTLAYYPLYLNYLHELAAL